MGLEDTMEHMIWAGGAVISNDPITAIQQVAAKIKAVTLADLKRVAMEVLDPRHLNVALIGPFTQTQEKQMRGKIFI